MSVLIELLEWCWYCSCRRLAHMEEAVQELAAAPPAAPVPAASAAAEEQEQKAAAAEAQAAALQGASELADVVPVVQAMLQRVTEKADRRVVAVGRRSDGRPAGLLEGCLPVPLIP